jgi:hypothetical protein
MGLHFADPQEELPDVFQMEPLLTSYFFVKASFAEFIIDNKWRPASLTRLEDLQPFTY